MAEAGYDLLEGLPAPGVLLSPKDDRAAIFGILRNWVKAVSSRGSLLEAGRILGEKYRCAVVCFVSRETAGGVRRNQAQEILKIFADTPGWTEQAAMSIEELEASAQELKEQPPPAILGAARSGIMREVLDGLPTRNMLEDSSANQLEMFSDLHTWIKARQRAARLAEAGALVDLDHRRSIFNFLCSFTARKTVMRSRSREALWLLAGIEEWCAGDAVDQTALAEVLGDVKDVLPRSMGGRRGDSVEPNVPKSEGGMERQKSDEATAARRRKYAPAQAAPGSPAGDPKFCPDAKAVVHPPGRQKAANPGGLYAQNLLQPEAFEGLPSRNALASPDADGRDESGREVFKALKDWVREKKHSGTLEQVAALMDPDYRRSIFTFLCNFVEKKTVFRDQARALLRQLSEQQAWLDGGAADVAAIERALGGAKAPRDGGRDSDDSLSPKDEQHPAEAQLPTPEEVEAEDELQVELPSSKELQGPLGDAQDLFRKVVVWTLVHSEHGRLDEEGKQLTADHRGAIFRFVCGFASPKKLNKKTALTHLQALARKVLKELDACEEWHVGRPSSISAEVAEALRSPR